MSQCLPVILALFVGLGSASDVANGWATSDGNACVECTYQGETFDACGKVRTNYIWCCTMTNNGAYINQQDTSTEVRGWGKCDVESSGPRPSPTPASTPVTKTCSEYNVAWAAAQLFGGGCAEDTKFFDLKKVNTEFSYDGSDASIKAGCCSAYADAKCADWIKVCTNGKVISTNSAPADGPSGDTTFSTLSDAKFQESCCTTEPVTATAAPVPSGATSIQLADVTGLSAGMLLTISDFSNSETKTIVSVTTGTSRRLVASSSRRLAAGSVTLDSALQNSYAAGAAVAAKPPGEDEASSATSKAFSLVCIAVLVNTLLVQ